MAKTINIERHMSKTVDGGTTTYTLYSTDIVVISPDCITLNSGGHKTSLTKDRMNKYLPEGFSVSRAKNDWWVQTPRGRFHFHDGISFQLNGEPCTILL